MSFANPWALWLAILGLPLLVAFLMGRWRRKRTISSLVIFSYLKERSQSRRRFVTVHHLLALFLNMLAMAALILALMHPRATQLDEARRFILVIDTSASMGVIEPGQSESRLSRATSQLGDFLRELNPDDQLALIEAGPEMRIRLGFTKSRQSLMRTVGSLVPLGDGVALFEALRVADALCQESPTSEIILVSDGAGLVVPELSCPLRFARVGSPAPNLAITGFAVRQVDALGFSELYLAVHNATPEPALARVELLIDGALIDVLSFELPSDTTTERLERLPLPPGEVLMARLSANQTRDALTDDDQAYAALTARPPVRTLLVDERPTSFMAEAARLHPRVRLETVRPSEVDPSSGPYDLLIVSSPYDGELPESAQHLFLDVYSQRLALVSQGQVRNPEVIRWEFDDPLFRFVNLDGLRISRATAIQLPTSARSLVDMADGPLVFTLGEEERSIFFAFHPDQSDLPLRVAFVNLFANLVEWAQPNTESDFPSSLPVGTRLRSGEQSLLVQRVAVDEHESPLAPLTRDTAFDQSGVYAILDPQHERQGLLAVNLFSQREADLNPTERLNVGAMQGWPEVQPHQEFPDWLLLLAALVLLTIEWLLPALLAIEKRLASKPPEQRASRLSKMLRPATPTKASPVMRGD